MLHVIFLIDTHGCSTGTYFPNLVALVFAFVSFITGPVMRLAAVCAVIAVGVSLSQGGEMHDAMRKIAVLAIVIAAMMATSALAMHLCSMFA